MKKLPAVLSLITGVALVGWSVYHYMVTLDDGERRILDLNASLRQVQQQMAGVNEGNAVLSTSPEASAWAFTDGAGSFNEGNFVKLSERDYWPGGLGAEMLRNSKEEANLVGKRRVLLVHLRQAESWYLKEVGGTEQTMKSSKRWMNVGIGLGVVLCLLLPPILLRIVE